MESRMEKELMLYCLKQALEHAQKDSESTFHLCAGDELKKVLPKLIEFVEKYEAGDKIELKIKRKEGPIAPGMSCKEKVELLMQRSEGQYERINELSRRVAELEYKVRIKDVGWDLQRPTWSYENPCYVKGPMCAAPTNDVSTRMSDGSVAQAQKTTDWRGPEPQTDAIPDAPPEREA